MRNIILQIIKEKPKNYSKIIKSKSDLYSWVLEHTLVTDTTIFGEMVYSAVHQISNICDHSNKIKKFKNFNSGYSFCGNQGSCQCNKIHSQKKVVETSERKYGVPRFNNPSKTQNTKKERYGDSSYNNRDKMKQTNIEKYGNECPLRLGEFKEKSEKTNLRRYGTKVGAQSKVVQEKINKTNLRRYGVKWYGNPLKGMQTKLDRYGCHNNQKHYNDQTKEILRNKNKFIDFVTGMNKAHAALKLGIDTTTISSYVNKYECNNVLNKNESKLESIIREILDEYRIQYEQGNRQLITPYELDFYLPDYNIAIEVNGNYWHSEKVTGRGKAYHHNKWLACREQEIDLYSYFEDELIDNIDIIKSKIKYLTNKNKKVIGARQCQINLVSVDDERKFLNKYHIQGFVSARNKTIGAYYNEELVAVFSWLQRKQYLEITRFACDSKASYPGLFSKMMKYMIKELDYHGPIVSFSNNGHSNGGVYKASGFKIDSILKGAYWYTKDYFVRENRQNYMKDKIEKKFGIDMSNKTEWQAMQELGYDRIWDTGKIKWIIIK